MKILLAKILIILTINIRLIKSQVNNNGKRNNNFNQIIKSIKLIQISVLIILIKKIINK